MRAGSSTIGNDIMTPLHSNRADLVDLYNRAAFYRATL